MVFQDGKWYVNEKGQFRATVVFDNLIHSGEMPIVGVNTFVNEDEGKPSAEAAEEFDVAVTRSDDEERQMVVDRNRAFIEAHAAESAECLDRLRQVAEEGGNMFECIMEIVDHVTLGQITEVLFETQGRFRRDL